MKQYSSTESHSTEKPADVISLRKYRASSGRGTGEEIFTGKLNTPSSDLPNWPVTRRFPISSSSFDHGTAITSEVIKQLLVTAYHDIVDALDDDLDRIERSNCFDDWKDTLKQLSHNALKLSINHRKVLGALIAGTQGKDLFNFDQVALEIFKDAMYELRYPTITGSASKKIIVKLIENNVEITIPLTTTDDGEKNLMDAEKLLKSIIAKAKK